MAWLYMDFPGGASGKDPLAYAGDIRDLGSISWRKAQQPTPVFLSGESHGQRSLVGYSP